VIENAKINANNMKPAYLVSTSVGIAMIPFRKFE
jgi:hypothetical protein